MHKNPQSNNEQIKRHCSCRVNTSAFFLCFFNYMGAKISSTTDQLRMSKTNITIMYFITIAV